MTRLPVIWLTIVLVGCGPSYQAATLSTMAPKTRLTLADSTKVEIQQPEVRGDSLYSANARAIPVDSVARVEAERGVSEAGMMAAIVGAVVGLALASQLGGLGSE